MAVWRNNKKPYEGHLYKSYHEFDYSGTERYRKFILKRIANDDPKHHVTFESWQMAVSMGWRKVTKR